MQWVMFEGQGGGGSLMLLAVDLPLCQQVEQYRTLYEEWQMNAVAAQAEVSGVCV